MALKQPPASACVAIDQEATRERVKDLLRAEGVMSFDTARSGKEAVELLERRSDAELVVLGWSLKDPTGQALFNRIRARPSTSLAAVIVISNDLSRSDARLLDEFPCSRVFEMPLVAERFALALSSVWAEFLWCREQYRTISALLLSDARDGGKLAAACLDAVTGSPKPGPLALLFAEYLMDLGHPKDAEALFRRALDRESGSTRMLGGIGRSLYLQGKHGEALGYLRSAARECPTNINRLCIIGELELSNFNVNAASKRFDEALALDCDLPVAKAGATLCSNLKDFVSSRAGKALPRDMASVCNAVGVTLVRDKAYDRGIAQYQAALALLRDDLSLARVMFNLGLAYLRMKRYDDAKAWFEKASAKGGTGVPKAAAYLKLLGKRGPHDRPSEPQFCEDDLLEESI